MGAFITGAFIGAGAMIGNVWAKNKNRGMSIENWPFFILSSGLIGALWGLVIIGPVLWVLGNFLNL